MRARQLAALGQLHAAREHWLAALNLVPADSPEHRGILREIQKIDQRLAPKKPTDWKKRFGPFGVIIAAAIKYKSLALVLLTKGKFLISILLFVGVYWGLFGWWFAVGLTGSVLLHEMGHYIMVRRFGFAAELPMFLPGFGAYVKWNGANVDPSVRAQISLAGPLFGFFSGLIAYAIFLKTGFGGWLAVVARNRSIDNLRRRRPTDQVEEIALASPGNLAEEAERNIMMERARAAIVDLPLEQRKTLEMAFFEGLTHTEIAERTGDPLGTVKTRIRSALLSLRKAFNA